eukprot:4871116-Amphidinium_carterae.2
MARECLLRRIPIRVTNQFVGFAPGAPLQYSWHGTQDEVWGTNALTAHEQCLAKKYDFKHCDAIGFEEAGDRNKRKTLGVLNRISRSLYK